MSALVYYQQQVYSDFFSQKWFPLLLIHAKLSFVLPPGLKMFCQMFDWDQVILFKVIHQKELVVARKPLDNGPLLLCCLILLLCCICFCGLLACQGGSNKIPQIRGLKQQKLLSHRESVPCLFPNFCWFTDNL